MNKMMGKNKPEGASGIKGTIHNLESSVSNRPELVTLYIPASKKISEVTGELRARTGLSDITHNASARSGIKDTFYEIISSLRVYDHVPDNGLAIFCGPFSKNNSDPVPSCTMIEPPEPVTMYLFRISTHFETEPLRQLAEGRLTGLLVLDLQRAYWGVIGNGRIELLGNTGSNVPAKQGQGGQSAARFQQLRKIAIHEYFMRVGENAGADFNIESRDPGTFNGVIIGGPTPTRMEFAKGNYFYPDIQNKILGIFDVSAVNNDSLVQLAEKTKELLRARDDESGEGLMREFLANLSKGNGLFAYGEQDVRKNLSAKSVRTLLLSSALRKSRMQITCTECGHADERTVALDSESDISTILAHTCRVCSSPIVVDEQVGIMEEMTSLAHLAGAKTMIVSDDSEDGSRLMSTFGGVAAILRYRTAE